MGLVDQAERLYRQAADADPRNSIAVVGLARVALERGDDAEAWRQAKRALEIDPENATAQRLVARLEEVFAHRGQALPEPTPGCDACVAEPAPRPSPTRRRVPAPGTPCRRRARAGSSPAPTPAAPAPAPAPAPRPRQCPRAAPAPRPSTPRTAPTRIDHCRATARHRRPPAWEITHVKVLVTGGAGYVGGVSVDALIEAGHEVVVLDDLTTGHAAIVNPAARLVRGSYGDEAGTRALLEVEQIDAILHCAARSLVGESVLDPAKYYRDNVAGGIALLEAARAAGVRRVVFSSTAAVYGVPDRTPIEEDDALRPINTYGETKRTFEGALRWYGQAYGFRSVILRYFNVAGATERLGEVHRPETHLIPNVLLAAEGGPPLTLFGDDYPTPDGTPIRDYIHVSDLARRAPRRAARDRSRRRADGTCRGRLRTARLQPRDVERLLGARCARARPRRSPAARSRTPSGRAARAIPRCWWPPTPAPARSSAGRRAARASTEMIGSAWAWRRAHPAATGTDGPRRGRRSGRHAEEHAADPVHPERDEPPRTRRPRRA